ncbi:MAG TPA: glycosyltransferase family 4 protein [Ignavibacteria bacterium]
MHLVKNFDFGGAENHVRELANSLDEQGHNVYIFARKGRQVNLLNKGIGFISLRFKDVLMPFQVGFICYFSLKNKIQVIHAHQRLPILMACLVGKITGIPVVVTVHGRTRYDLRYWISRKYPEKIIFVSRYVFEESARFVEIQHKSVIIPNWVSVSDNKSEKRPYSICYISRIDKKHSTVILLMIQKVISRLVSKFPMITFRIIGEGDFLSEIREEAIRLNSKLKREACVVCGFIPDVKEIIQQSELVMGVGRVALEAMACGIPVLSINQKRMGTLISAENYSFYKNNNFVAVGNQAPDEKNLIDLLNSFFTDLKYWQKESLILQGYVNEDFNRLRISIAIAMLYDEVSESGRKKKIPSNSNSA